MKRLVFSIICLAIYSYAQSQNNRGDSIALKAIWNAMDGPNWTIYDWSGPTHMWTGVTWSNGRATRLSLNNARELKGTIPSEIGNLSELTSITLINPTIEGTLPSELNNLKKLTSLYIQDVGGRNDNSDYTLPDLSGLQALQRIRLQKYNISTNGFPNWLQNLPNLTSIQFGNVIMNDTIPNWLLNKKDLSVIFLSDNELTGNFPEFKGQDRLEFFGIGQQNFDYAEFPNWLENHLSLEGLYLFRINFSQPPNPNFFSKLPNLERATIIDVNLDNEASEIFIGISSKLSNLILRNSGIRGHINPANFNSDVLQTFDLISNEIGSVGDFSNFGMLNAIDLSYNYIPHEQIELMFDSLGSRRTFAFNNQTYTLPDSLHISLGDSIELIADSNGDYDTYQWYQNEEPIMNETHKSLKLRWNLSNAGSYKCIISNTLIQNTSSTTSCFVSIENPSKNSTYSPRIRVYPNPFQSKLFSTYNTYTKVLLHNHNGMLIDSKERLNDLELSYLPSGLYFLSIINKGKIIHTEQVIKD